MTRVKSESGEEEGKKEREKEEMEKEERMCTWRGMRQVLNEERKKERQAYDVTVSELESV